MSAPHYSRSEWEQQYRSGRWKHLGESGEAGRVAYMAKYAHLRGARCILDVGCGAGHLYEALGGGAFPGLYLGIDWSLAALPAGPWARTHGFVCADADRLPVRGRFDLIVASEVLYYLTDPTGVLRTLRDLLTRDGSLLVSVYQPRREHEARWRPVVQHLEHELLAMPHSAPTVRLREEKNDRLWHIYTVSRMALSRD